MLDFKIGTGYNEKIIPKAGPGCFGSYVDFKIVSGTFWARQSETEFKSDLV